MGKNCEEKGTLTLPSAAIVPLRNALVSAINEQRVQWLELATKIHTHLRSDAGAEDRKTLAKLLRGKPTDQAYSLEDFIDKKIAQFETKSNWDHWNRRHTNGLNRTDESERNYAIWRMLFTQPKVAGELRKIQAPKKKDLPPLLASKTWAFGNSECGVSIDPKARTLRWSVPEGKNAVDDAWASLLGRTLNEELKKVKWTRGTGGAFNYTDEYQSDGAMEHGYNPISISQAFGPLAEAERDHRSGLSGLRRATKRVARTR